MPSFTPPAPWRIAIVSNALPPQLDGQAVILDRLLGGLLPGAQVRFSSTPGLGARQPSGIEFVALRRSLRHRASAAWAWLLDALPATIQIAWEARRRGCRAIVGCSGGPELLAAWLAAGLTGLQFHAWMFDHFRYQLLAQRGLTAALERRMMRAAKSVLVPNEALATALRDLYGVSPNVVRCPAPGSAESPSAPWPRRPGELRIVYTGSVYHAQADALQRLVLAIREAGLGARLHVHSPQPAAQMRPHGFEPDAPEIELHPAVHPAEVTAIQQRADVLYLPLAFSSPYPEIIATSLPGKTGEYLASGRPVLVHAPRESHLASYVRRHGCAILVDEPEVEALARAIARLVADPALREQTVARARERAQEDFGLGQARHQLLEALAVPASARAGGD